MAALKHPSYHLRAFVICLVVILIALVSVLFGVHMEAVTHGAGIVKVRDMVELRPAGPDSPNWAGTRARSCARAAWSAYGSTGSATAPPTPPRARFARSINSAVPKEPRSAWNRCASQARKRRPPLARPGGRLRPLRRSLAAAWPDAVRTQSAGPRLTFRLASIKTCIEQDQAVKPGDVLAWLAPVDPATGRANSFIAQIDVVEKHAAGLEAGQDVRLVSTMYNQRLHGHAEGVVEKVEPLAEAAENGERRFRIQVKITHAPFELHHGMSVKAEIVLGHKRVYRIILEQ